MPRTVNPKVRLDPNTKVPTQTLQMMHQLRIGKAAVAQKHHVTGKRHKRRSLIQQHLVHLIGHRRAAMVDDTPHQWHGATAIDHRPAHHAVGIPQHRGIQGHIEGLVSPAAEGLLNERTIQGMHFDPVVVEPAPKPAYRTLTITGSTHHIRRPSTQAHRAGMDQPDHHPRQSLEMAKIKPISMLTEHMNQRIIKVRRVLHDDPP
jgi:hypothetical protein